MYLVTKIKVEMCCYIAKQEHWFLSSQYYTSKDDFYIVQKKSLISIDIYNIFYIEHDFSKMLIGYQMVEKKVVWNQIYYSKP